MSAPDDVLHVLRALTDGQVVVLHDDVRGADAVLAGPASVATTAMVAFMVRHGSGYVCAGAPARRWDALRVPSAAEPGRAPSGPHLGVAFDAADGVTTGISARDRGRSLRVAADPGSTPRDLTRPGHVVSVRLRDEGVLARLALEEAAGDVVRLAGVGDTVAYAHLVSVEEPTELAASPEALRFAGEHTLACVGLREVEALRVALAGDAATALVDTGSPRVGSPTLPGRATGS